MKDYNVPTNQLNWRNTTSAQVYALTLGDTEVSNEVVIGILIVLFCKAIVLFDSGTTHSFVSCNLVRVFDLASKWLEVDLAIATPVGRT